MPLKTLGWFVLCGAITMAVLAASCGDDDGAKTTPTPAPTTATAPGRTSSAGANTPTRPAGSPAATATPTLNVADFKRPPTVTAKTVAASAPQAVLKDVRVGRNEGYDRIVFEFQGNDLPGYEVKWVQSALQCGSGKPVYTDGQAQLQVTIRPAVAHDQQGKLTIPSTQIKSGFPAIKEAVSSCDFEGVVQWVVGAADTGYRVTEMTNPTRLVIDIRQ